MSLVLDICTHVYVLDFGELIFDGTPAEISASPIVQAAYLGDAEVEQAIDPTHRIEELA
jgi:ABC-type branched-subunit amino acid transport system ATPase component